MPVQTNLHPQIPTDKPSHSTRAANSSDNAGPTGAGPLPSPVESCPLPPATAAAAFASSGAAPAQYRASSAAAPPASSESSPARAPENSPAPSAVSVLHPAAAPASTATPHCESQRAASRPLHETQSHSASRQTQPDTQNASPASSHNGASAQVPVAEATGACPSQAVQPTASMQSRDPSAHPAPHPAPAASENECSTHPPLPHEQSLPDRTAACTAQSAVPQR